MKKLLTLSHALLFFAALAISTGTRADSPCKGLSEGACSANSKCTWVGAYKQKDGDQVKAYCRAKPGYGDSGKPGKKADKKQDKRDEAVKADDDKSEKQKSKISSKKKDAEAKPEAGENKKDSDGKSAGKAKKEKKKKKKSGKED